MTTDSRSTEPIASSRLWRVRTILALLALGLFAYASIRVVRHQIRSPTDGDWGVYYRTGLAMWRRQPIYTLDHGPLLTFKNAPAVALMLVPISLLPIGLARWLWLVGDLISLAIIYQLAARVVLAPQTTRTERLAFIGGAIFLSAHYIMDELFSGPTAMVVVMLTVASFVWAYEGKGIRAGTALALGIFLKLVPFAFVPWLFCCKSRRSSLGALLVTSCLLAVLPAIWVGWNRNLQLLEEWPAHLARTEIHQQDYRTKNQSVNAVLTRFLTDTPFDVNIANLDWRTVEWLNLIALLLGAIALYGAIARNSLDRRSDPGAVLSLLLIYMTVFNPLAWRYNYVAVGIAYLYVLHALWRGVQRQGLVITLVAGSYLLHFAPDAMQALGARLWGTAALAVAVVLCPNRGIRTTNAVAGRNRCPV
jgi:hypothetical protein